MTRVRQQVSAVALATAIRLYTGPHGGVAAGMVALAILAAARAQATTASEVKVLSFVPFDATRRRTEAVVQADGPPMRVVKGAVDVVAQVCAP